MRSPRRKPGFREWKRVPGVVHRVHRTPTEWREIMARFRASGQSKSPFCERNTISRSTFILWERRLAAGDNGSTPAAPEEWFVEVGDDGGEAPPPHGSGLFAEVTEAGAPQGSSALGGPATRSAAPMSAIGVPSGIEDALRHLCAMICWRRGCRRPCRHGGSSRARIVASDVLLDVEETATMSGEASEEGKFASWQSYRRFSKTVQREHRYVWPEAVREFLEAVRKTAKKREVAIPKDQPFFRAQVGWERDEEARDDGTAVGPMAFGPERMKPTASHAVDYRANAAGIPVLYLAMETETAIAEVRPWIGSRVSVSLFTTTRELRALDLTPEFGRHWMPAFSTKDGGLMSVDAGQAEKSVWTDIDNAFSRPVSRSDDQADYVPTQILAELFQADGYDAIIYRSQLGEDGYNVVIFNLADADPQDGRPYEVARIDLCPQQVGNPWVRREQSRMAQVAPP